MLDLKDILKIGGIVSGGAILLLAMAILNAFVLVMIWGWYISPYFPVPSLDMIHAFGLTMIVGLFRTQAVPGSKAAKEAVDVEGVKHPIITTVMAELFKALTGLLIGWIGTFWL